MIKRCFRCAGRKKMYKVGSAYSMTDMGGEEVDCPLCLGEGDVDVPKVIEKKTRKRRDKSEPRIVEEPVNV